VKVYEQHARQHSWNDSDQKGSSSEFSTE
jgi:hypothetical protein